MLDKPQDPEHPYVFRHQYGTLTVYAQSDTEAELKAKRLSRGMRVIPDFQKEQVHAPVQTNG